MFQEVQLDGRQSGLNHALGYPTLEIRVEQPTERWTLFVVVAGWYGKASGAILTPEIKQSWLFNQAIELFNMGRWTKFCKSDDILPILVTLTEIIYWWPAKINTEIEICTYKISTCEVPNVTSEHGHRRVSHWGHSGHKVAVDDLPVTQIDEIPRRDPPADVGARLMRDVGVTVDDLK